MKAPTDKDRLEYERGRISGRLDAKDGFRPENLRRKSFAYREGYIAGYQKAQAKKVPS